jgi:hypothetical protein
MPGLNKTGPRGIGPMTGGGRGLCNSLGANLVNRGNGFGFSGSSPSLPYIGRGRGGLPRCWFPGLTGGTSASNITREQELEMLKNQSQTMKEQLEQLENRMKELAKEV